MSSLIVFIPSCVNLHSTPAATAGTHSSAPDKSITTSKSAFPPPNTVSLLTATCCHLLWSSESNPTTSPSRDTTKGVGWTAQLSCTPHAFLLHCATTAGSYTTGVGKWLILYTSFHSCVLVRTWKVHSLVALGSVSRWSARFNTLHVEIIYMSVLFIGDHMELSAIWE